MASSVRTWALAAMIALGLVSTCSIHTLAAQSSQPSTVSPAPPRARQVAARAPSESAADPRVEELKARLDGVLAGSTGALGSGAKVGVAVIDIDSGETVYTSDGDGQYNAASNTKLVTASAALALLGPDFRYYTALYGVPKPKESGVVDGDLFIRGRGDPGLGTGELYQMARDLRQSGITRVTGGVVVDASYFDNKNLPPHFDEKPDDHASYRAPVAATSLNFNAVAISLRPAAGGAGPSLISVEPPNDYVVVESSVQTVRSGRTRIRMETETTRENLRLKIIGQIRADDGERRYRRRVPNPVLYLGSALRSALIASGIQVSKKQIRSAPVPPQARALAWRVSEPLSVLVRGLGKYSNNYVAEMLLKTIGAEQRQDKTKPATWDDGLSAVTSWLGEHIGWKAGAYYYGNGSGLFASNRFSPRQLSQLLVACYRDFRFGPDLIASLSIGGVDGTTSRRMSNGPAAGLVRAKTGTLDGVSALSGYVALDGRAPLAFSILVNGFADSAAGRARALQDSLVEAMIPYLDASP